MDDGIIEIRPGDQKLCPPGLHDDVPIIEGNRSVGFVCTICGRSTSMSKAARAEATESSPWTIGPEGDNISLKGLR